MRKRLNNGFLQKEHFMLTNPSYLLYLQRLTLDISLQKAFKYRRRRFRYLKSYCEFCGRHAKTEDHHITLVHKLKNRFLPVVANRLVFEEQVINHPRNLISLCSECHSSVHSINTFTADPQLTKIFKAIKRYNF